MPFSCYIIGHGSLTLDCLKAIVAANHRVLGVQSSEPEVLRYCVRHTIATVDGIDQLHAAMSASPAEYLFSIINPDRVPSAVLALASRGSINFHDSPLPRYAGLNAVSWAVQNQESDYGVTWHLMSEQFDAGDILIQPRFELEPDETAFTLALRCHAEGLASFHQLLDKLGRADLQGEPQAPSQGSVFLGKQRPADAAVLNWRKSASENAALVRGLSFGPEVNPLSSAKIRISSSFYQVRAAQVTTESQSQSAPGKILSLTPDYIDIGTGEGVLRVLELAELHGAAVDLSVVKDEHDLQVGQSLATLTTEQSEALKALTKAMTTQEAFWREMLLAESPTAPLEAKRSSKQDAESSAELAEIVVPEATMALIGEAFSESKDSSLVLESLYYCYLAKLQGASGSQGEVWLSRSHASTDRLGLELCSQYVPARVTVDRKNSVRELIGTIVSQLEKLSGRGTYWCDLPDRLKIPAPARQIGVVHSLPADAPIVRSGFALTFRSHTGTQGHRFLVDTEQLSTAAAARHCELFFGFVEHALQAPSAPLEACQLLTGAERRLVLESWNATERQQANTSSYATLIEQAAARTPDATALVYADNSITYKTLSEQAKRVAAGLLNEGVAPGSLVGVYVPRSIEMVVALIGIGYAGAAYVPLDPGYPADRIRLMIEDADLQHIICADNERPANISPLAQLLPIEALISPGLAGVASAHVTSNSDLAYVIYTSGSTGKPKGVMVEHRNLNNFFLGMDEVLNYQGEPGVWLAVTSISFDISVLELIWTLTRGFKVVIQADNLAARQVQKQEQKQTRSNKPVDFSLFYFSSDAGPQSGPSEVQADQQKGRYRLLLEGAKFADANDFSAIWTPERHFHLFGGLYPNPSVTSAAVAAVTNRIGIRAGSIVLPLHHPVRVAEEWSVVDNLSNGRVGFSFASGWHANDFALKPENYQDRKQLMFDGIDTVLKLWKGESLQLMSGDDKPFTAKVFPPPVQEKPPIWITAAGSPETFQAAGASGHNLLTNLLGQSVTELKGKIDSYRQARAEAGFSTPGTVSLMLHTFIGEDVEAVRAIVKEPFCHYLKTSFDLVKIAPWAFPAFSQPSRSMAQDPSLDTSEFTEEDLDALVEHAFDRYFETAGLFGTPESVLPLVDELKEAGVSEFACLLDFGVDEDAVLGSLDALNRLRLASQPTTTQTADAVADNSHNYSLEEQLSRHQVTHFQCTPSMARLLWSNEHNYKDDGHLQHLLLGGEALPLDLANRIVESVSARLINVYGPTETTIWSTASQVSRSGVAPSIGKPIANTQIYILDGDGQPLPAGLPGELCIGGAGVVRGYLDRPELTAEKFFDNPFGRPGERLYRTGDLAAWSADGTIDFMGRLDHQVKLRGYRIELGEIEQAIATMPTVAEAVVVAHQNENEDARLAAYVVPADTSESADTVASWQSAWSDAYSSTDSQLAGTTMNTAGWLNSFTGEQHSQEEMQEWVDATCTRILARKPQRVLEIGCGTGMLLFPIAPKCEEYVATDISEVALQSIKRQLPTTGLSNVILEQRAADEIEGISDQPFDLIILNSVAQYFPSSAYLVSVLETALQLLAPGGELFVGDVRSLQHLTLFHETTERHRSLDTDTVAELRQRTHERAESEAELVCDPKLFAYLGNHFDEIESWNIRLKDAAAHNEMSMFRYDVLLKKRGGESEMITEWRRIDAAATPQAQTLEGLVALLSGADSPTIVSGIPNARLAEAVGFSQALAAASPADPLIQLTASGGGAAIAAIDPDVLVALLPDMRLEFSWDSTDRVDEMTVRACPNTAAVSVDVFWQPSLTSQSGANTLAGYSNQPAARKDDQPIATAIKTRLGRSLPDFMIPSDIVVLAALPLTPNGKVDRKRLPAPERDSAARTEAFVAPGDSLEQQIADVFAAMLNIDAIGIHDNFFDAGANSLLVVQANSRLSTLLKRKVPLVSMYRFPTVASLASQLRGSSADESKSATKAVSRAQRRKQARAGRRRGPN